MHRNYGPTSEPYKYTAAKEEKQLGGDLKERFGLLKALVFILFYFLLFSLFLFIFIFRLVCIFVLIWILTLAVKDIAECRFLFLQITV